MKYFTILVLLLISLVISCGNGSIEDKAEEQAASVQGNVFEDQVLQQIYTLQNQRDSNGLKVYLQDKNPKYRRAAANSFASVQSAEAVEPLALLLADKNEAVRCAAAYALGQIKDKKAEPLLIKAYQGESMPGVKKDILEAIGKCGTEQGLSFITGLKFEKNQPLLLAGQAWGLYRFALQNIVSDQGTGLALELLDRDIPEQVRLVAAHYLGRTGGIDLTPYAGQLILTLQWEKNNDTRMALVLALGKALRPEVSEHLKSFLKPGEQVDYRIRVNALGALGRFEYNDIKDSFFKMLSHADVNIAVAASEYFLTKGVETDINRYFEIAQKLDNWRPRANMLTAALKYAPSQKDKKPISGWVIDAYKKSINNYEKAFLLKALAGDINNYAFLESHTFDNVGKIPVISTYGMDALVEMSRTVKEEKNMLEIFAEIFKKAVESGDPALILFAANILREPGMNFKEIYKDTDFLTTALNKCELPKDLEGWLELRQTIDFFKGTQRAASPLPLKNHPIDWKLVTSIPPDQQIRIKTGKGDITIQLMVNDAPGSVSNFVRLIKENFYQRGRRPQPIHGQPDDVPLGTSSQKFAEKTKFHKVIVKSVIHRVVPNFVIQDGCPRGDGVGGPAFTIGSELGPLYYEEGSVGMASAGKDTEGSQWFITHSPTPHLDGRYTIFAKVVKGMEVVHKIEIGDKILGFEFL
jgi:cyclophilin family peptidyl-prolyl cis-trans isomerase/HEAT repeat protein